MPTAVRHRHKFVRFDFGLAIREMFSVLCNGLRRYFRDLPATESTKGMPSSEFDFSRLFREFQFAPGVQRSQHE